MFYRDVLGLEVGSGDETSGYADLKTGDGSDIALFDRTYMAEAIGTEHLPPEAESMDRVCLVFHVDSVDESYEQLQKKGVEFINEPHDRGEWGVRVAHFRDLGGNLIEINEPIELKP